jgi:hypothetical protein
MDMSVSEAADSTFSSEIAALIDAKIAKLMTSLDSEESLLTLFSPCKAALAGILTSATLIAVGIIAGHAVLHMAH